MTQEPVLVHVYDMSRINEYTTRMGFGIYHSGVEVYGEEYGYGGHNRSDSGIFNMVPKLSSNLGDRCSYRESICMGTTNFTFDQVQNILDELDNNFRGDEYHLINRNCNHFSKTFAKILCGKDIPSWINRLAYVSSCIPFIRLMSNKWFTPPCNEQCVSRKSSDSSSLQKVLPNSSKSIDLRLNSITNGSTEPFD